MLLCEHHLLAHPTTLSSVCSAILGKEGTGSSPSLSLLASVVALVLKPVSSSYLCRSSSSFTERPVKLPSLIR